MKPLNAYRDTYNIYSEFLELDIDEYIGKLRSKKISLEEIEAEINSHLVKQDEIELTYVDNSLLMCVAFQTQCRLECSLSIAPKYEITCLQSGKI